MTRRALPIAVISIAMSGLLLGCGGGGSSNSVPEGSTAAVIARVHELASEAARDLQHYHARIPADGHEDSTVPIHKAQLVVSKAEALCKETNGCSLGPVEVISAGLAQLEKHAQRLTSLRHGT